MYQFRKSDSVEKMLQWSNISDKKYIYIIKYIKPGAL